MTSRKELLKVQVTSLDPEAMRKHLELVGGIYGSDMDPSPFYPRDKGRPGWITWYTIYGTPRAHAEPRVIQLELTKEIA